MNAVPLPARIPSTESIDVNQTRQLNMNCFPYISIVCQLYEPLKLKDIFNRTNICKHTQMLICEDK